MFKVSVSLSCLAASICLLGFAMDWPQPHRDRFPCTSLFVVVECFSCLELRAESIRGTSDDDNSEESDKAWCSLGVYF